MATVRALEDNNAPTRGPKIVYEDNIDKWNNAERPGTVFEEEG